MKKMKIYILTYKRVDILNDTLEKLFSPKFENKVNVLNTPGEE